MRVFVDEMNIEISTLFMDRLIKPVTLKVQFWTNEQEQLGVGPQRKKPAQKVRATENIDMKHYKRDIVRF